jgi:small subunit ribosomal protein S13
MARITGVELQDNWKVDYALTKIYGIGWSLSGKILKSVKIDTKNRVSDLSRDDLNRITTEIEKYQTEGDLTRQVRENVTRLKTIGSYRGIRHTRGLPARGQRTKSNARTKRGKRKTVGAFKKSEITKLQQTDKSK